MRGMRFRADTWVRPYGGCLSFPFSIPENTIIKAEHIECGHGGNTRHNPSHRRAELEAGGQNFVFGEKARERPNARNGKTGYQESDVGDGHVFAQPAHRAHFIAVYGMNDASCSQEE